MGLVLDDLLSQGGLGEIERRNREKASLLYGSIDGSQGFYKGHAQPESRSWMNVCFRLPSTELEERFADGAEKEGLFGLRGHRSVGGIRASTYNARSVSSVRLLVEYMEEFRGRWS